MCLNEEDPEGGPWKEGESWVIPSEPRAPLEFELLGQWCVWPTNAGLGMLLMVMPSSGALGQPVCAIGAACLEGLGQGLGPGTFNPGPLNSCAPLPAPASSPCSSQGKVPSLPRITPVAGGAASGIPWAQPLLGCQFLLTSGWGLQGLGLAPWGWGEPSM